MPKTTAHPDWEALAPAVLAGDESAWLELVAKLHAYALVVARRFARMYGRPFEAEDLAAEAMIYVLKYARNYRPGRGSTFVTWATLVIRASMLNQVRRRRCILAVSLDAGEDGVTIDVPARPEPDPWDAEDARHRVRRLLRPLPAKFRRIVLRHAAGESAAAIARSLGLSASRVTYIIRDCHAKLRAAARRMPAEVSR